jgi:hypothetical protein
MVDPFNGGYSGFRQGSRCLGIAIILRNYFSNTILRRRFAVITVQSWWYDEAISAVKEGM